MRRVAACAVLAAVAVLQAQERTLHLPPLDRVLPPRAERAYAALVPRIGIDVALDAVNFMSRYWRLAGNPGYERSLSFLADRLAESGFVEAPGAGASYRTETFENTGYGWEQVRGTLSLEGPPRLVVLSREQDRLALCINSFSTADGGVTLPLVGVGSGTAAADYEGKTVAGAVVFATGPVATVWARAVRERGAAGVVSSDIAPYTRPEDTPDVLQWGSIPYDEARRSFAFKATPRAAARLRAALAAGDARVHVEIATVFHRGPNRTLVAEMAGTSRSSDRVVLVAHVQEPGANDNASGSGTLLAVARALHDGIRRGALSRPSRTLTFLWLDEIRGSERWIADHPEAASRVVAMMSLDMTGQNTARTGGTFLIEKSPDPSALWPHPSDPHSEWGAGKVLPEWVRGHFLNDLHLAVALRRARDTGWVVRTNPYEGGSDHTVFTRRGVPSLLNWHFTDRYYHTNLDTPDKTSAETMAHVAATVATSALFLASATADDEAALRTLVNTAERARLATLRANAASDEVIAAWKKWYDEARGSVAEYLR